MRFIKATMTADGQVELEGGAGYVLEHNAACLAVELNDRFLAEDISFHCFCFDPLGLGQKLVGNNIYGRAGDSPAFRLGKKLYCPLPAGITRAGKVQVQLEAHRLFDGECVSVEKSAVFTLNFAPSLTGDEIGLAEDCGLLPRLQAALAKAEEAGFGIVHCTPARYAAIKNKNPLRFYLVDDEAPDTPLPEEPEEPKEPAEPEEPEEPEIPPEPEEPEPVRVSSISLNPQTAQLQAGKTLQLTALVLPADAHNKAVVFASSDPALATVSSTGLVTAKAAGSLTISATTVDGGYKAQCSLTVTAAARPGLWQGSKTANGITVTIQGKRVTINGTKNSNDSNQGGGYLTDNMPTLFGTPVPWQTFPAGTKLRLTVSNVTGTHNCKGINAACVLRKTDNTILMGGTWDEPAGVFEYTCSQATPVYGLLFYMQNGESCEGYGFDVDFEIV